MTGLSCLSFLPVIDAGATLLADLTQISSDDRARVLLLAIALQESGLRDRVQINGPAHGWWQFEQGGVTAVLEHVAAGPPLRAVCARLAVAAEPAAIYAAITDNDPLAYACARLLLWADPAELPATSDVVGGWQYYRRCWRPGRPRRWDWDENHAAALAAIAQGAAA
jgi:hypothetical protein